MTGIKILSTGKALPEKIVTNEDLSRLVDTSDEWITLRTGMKQRRYVTDKESTTLLAYKAAKEAIEKSGIDKNDIDVIIVATLSADNFTPSTACLLQKKLELKTEIIAMDINAACSGFVFGMEAMRGFLATGKKTGLLIGVECLSKKLDMTDRGTCILFGDGGAACVVAATDTKYTSITGVISDEDMIFCNTKEGKIHMDGQGTYKFAVATVPKLIEATISKAGLSVDEIDHFILHQANLRIIESVAGKLKQPIEKFMINIEKYGNTSAASVGLALADAVEEGRLKRKDKILLCAFGAGKTYGAIIFEW